MQSSCRQCEKQIRWSPQNLANSKAADQSQLRLKILWLLSMDNSKMISMWKTATYLVVIKTHNSQDKKKKSHLSYVNGIG